MRLKDTMIAWTPETERVRVGPHPDKTGWSSGYVMTSGACFLWWAGLSDEARLIALFSLFHRMILLDKIDPQIVHQAFLRIDEYREEIAPELRTRAGNTTAGKGT